MFGDSETINVLNLIFTFSIIYQLGSKPIIERSSLEQKWKHLSLPDDMLYEILRYNKLLIILMTLFRASKT